MKLPAPETVLIRISLFFVQQFQALQSVGKYRQAREARCEYTNDCDSAMCSSTSSCSTIDFANANCNIDFPLWNRFQGWISDCGFRTEVQNPKPRKSNPRSRYPKGQGQHPNSQIRNSNQQAKKQIPNRNSGDPNPKYKLLNPKTENRNPM